MRHLIFVVIIGLLALTLAFIGLPQSLATSSPVDFALTSSYAGGEVDVGATIQFTAQLTNVDAVSRTFVYALSIPQGTTFLTASDALQRNSYPVGAMADETVKSLTWNGQLEPQQRQTFTFTLQVASAGTLPGGDIPVTGLVFDAASGEELGRETVTLDWPGVALYFPLIARNSGPPTPRPTSTPTPTPTPLPSTGQFTATVAGTLQSQAGSYIAALEGSGYVAGNDVLYDKEAYQYPFLSLSLKQCNFLGTIMVHRVYVEYDTSGVGEFGNAYLVFRSDGGSSTTHSVEVYQGNWTQLLLTGTQEINPVNWNAQGTLIGAAPGTTNVLPITSTVTIPAVYVAPGGVTRFAIKTSTEGIEPPANSCFGSTDPGLGGSIGLPYLYILP